MKELMELILDYGQECEDRDANSSDTLDKIKSRLESMEKDAARIDWIEKTGRVNIDRVREGRIDGPIRWDVEYGHNDQEARSKKCLRAAIDTAMQANKGE